MFLAVLIACIGCAVVRVPKETAKRLIYFKIFLLHTSVSERLTLSDNRINQPLNIGPTPYSQTSEKSINIRPRLVSSRYILQPTGTRPRTSRRTMYLCFLFFHLSVFLIIICLPSRPRCPVKSLLGTDTHLTCKLDHWDILKTYGPSSSLTNNRYLTGGLQLAVKICHVTSGTESSSTWVDCWLTSRSDSGIQATSALQCPLGSKVRLVVKHKRFISEGIL